MDFALARASAPIRSLPAVETLRTLPDLLRIEADWDRLAWDRGAASDSAYANAWSAGLGDSQQLYVLLARTQAGRLPRGVALAPLVAHRGAAGRLTMLAAEMYEILDFLSTDEVALQALVRALVRTGRPLALKRIADGPVIKALRAAYRGRGFVRVQPRGGSPWIPLDETWGNPEMHLESGRRSDLRRARRNAEKLGRVEVEVIVPTPQHLPQLLAEAFQVEAAGWKGANGTALAADPVRGAFFRRYAEQVCAAGALRIGTLRIGGRAAAAQIAVEHGGRFDLLRAGYDERFSRCSPGSLLTAETIRYAARRGLRAYEFNGDVEPWTHIWTRHEHPSCSVQVYPFTPRGTAALIEDGIAAARGRIRRRLKK
ncbi:MAG: GNAT family N-acetyltransferase [Bryobacteraceae bacterium]|jgi:CelD/BcsL family acetyltransferase involved in cellulose biosynthesis